MTIIAHFWLDGAQVQNNSKKAKNPYRCSKNSLHKNFKLSLEQNVTNQTYPKIRCRSQKCLVQSLKQQFHLVNWFLFSNRIFFKQNKRWIFKLVYPKCFYNLPSGNCFMSIYEVILVCSSEHVNKSVQFSTVNIKNVFFK